MAAMQRIWVVNVDCRDREDALANGLGEMFLSYNTRLRPLDSSNPAGQTPKHACSSHSLVLL